jgi:uncharacterized membrane protein YgaE (UPF0421/DUF939 family)
MSQRREPLRATRAQFCDAVRAGLQRLWQGAWLIVQTAGAATLAWLLSAAVLGHHDPGFAPIGAVIAVEVTRGQRLRHAVELSIGVLLGVGIATLLGAAISSPAPRIAAVVAVTMALALLISASPVFIVQASVAAIFLAATPVASSGLAGEHLVEALIGCGVALLVTQVAFPVHPVRLVNRTAQPIFDQLADALDQVASALAAGDRRQAERALQQARDIDPLVDRLDEAIITAQQIARLAPFWRRTRQRLEPYGSAARKVDYAVRNTRVLARSAIELLRAERPAPAPLITSVRELAEAVRMLGGELVANEPRTGTQQRALAATAQAMAALDEQGALAVATVVGQVRSTALDLLRGSGMDMATAEKALDEAAGPVTDKP